MKLTTVTGKPANFRITKKVEIEVNRYLKREFEKQLGYSRDEKEASEIASLLLKYWVKEINDIVFENQDEVSDYMKDENDYIDEKLANKV